MGPLVQTTLSLLLVLGVILGFAYLVRRIQSKLPGNPSLIHVKSSIALGSKERLALVEVNGTWVLLGITSASINHVLTLPNPPDMPEDSVTSNKSWLQTYLSEKKE